MRLTLTRKWKSTNATLGELAIDGMFECFTLEDVVRPDGIKIPGSTAIPAGDYPVQITWSPRFQCLMPLLVGVPDFTGIRIHWGNVHGDTDGCILVGRERGVDRVTNSRMAYAELYEKLEHALAAGQSVRIDIINAMEV